MTHDKLDIVERAYEVEPEEEAWFGAIAKALRASVDGAVGSYIFEVGNEAGRLTLGRHWVESPEIGAELQRSFSELPREMLAYAFSEPLLATTAREHLTQAGFPFPGPVFGRAFAALGAEDLFTVGGYDPFGNGLCVGVLLAKADSSSTRGARNSWSQVAAHLAAAARLRGVLGAEPSIEHADAVMDLRGRVEHLGRELEIEQREQLGAAVRRIEGARARQGSVEESLDLWQALVAGEWSLVDHFESDGRRHYVAVRNPPEGVRARVLSRREREVVAYVASGSSTKTTAYALGLRGTTVRRHLHNAMAKLGVKSRAELVTLHETLSSLAE